MGDDGVPVGVAVDEGHDGRIRPEELLEGGPEAPRARILPAADRVVHRVDGVVGEGDRDLAGVRPEVGGEPVELDRVEAAVGSPRRVHGVEDDTVDARRGIEGVVPGVRGHVLRGEAMTDRRPVRSPVLRDPLPMREEPAPAIGGDEHRRALGPGFDPSAGMVAPGMMIPLGAFTFGEFQLIVKVTDNRNKQSAEQPIRFTVAP